MNKALPEMLHNLNTSEHLAGNCKDMTVLERQRARMKWQQDQLHQPQEHEGYFAGNEYSLFSMPTQLNQAQQFHGLINGDSVLEQFVNRALKADPDLESEWQDYGRFPVPRTGFHDESLGYESCGYANGTGFAMNFGVSRTTSCPLEVTAVVTADGKGGRESVLTEKMSSAAGSESFRKRKADKVHNSKVVAEDDTRDKKIKNCAEEGDSKITEQTNSKKKKNNNNNRETSADTSKENSKVSEDQKLDYIHVRARRGQATDSHSLDGLLFSDAG